MDYALAKKLKDFGFAQEGIFWTNPKNEIHIKLDLPDGECPIEEDEVIMPTLSELIEACSPEVVLMKDTGGKKWWIAAKGIKASDGNDWCFTYPTFYYQTPEEAVANLYLAIVSL